MVLRNESMCQTHVILDKDVRDKVKKRGNLSKIIRKLLQEYINDGNDEIKKERFEIEKAVPQKSISNSNRKSNRKSIEKSETTEKEQEDLGETPNQPQSPKIKTKVKPVVILCPNCNTENILISNAASQRICSKCKTKIRRANFKYVDKVENINTSDQSPQAQAQ